MDWTLISFWSLALLLIVVNAGSLVLNLLLLPGNWLMVASLTLYLLGTSFERGPTWTILIISVALAALGELLELMLGSAKAAHKGAWLGEAWIGTEMTRRNEIGTAAMSGRLIGMIAKFAIGTAIFAIQMVSFFFR